MCALKKFEWQIGGLEGQSQAENMRGALREAFDEFLHRGGPAICESLTSVRLRVRDANYTPPPVEREPVRSFVAYNHQNKGNAFIRALWERGYHRSDNTSVGHQVDFCLTDHAVLTRIAWLDDFAQMGTERFFVYPHTARPNLVNDITPEYQGVTAHFVSAPGHVEVMRAYGYEKPVHVVGWSLCPLRPFQPRPAPRQVLFAPIHERCAQVDQDANRAAFGRLYWLAAAGEIELTVRYYQAKAGHGLEGSGLEQVRHPNIRYMAVESLDPDWEQIDAADVVVAHQTFAWLAVARGVPTVMLAEDMPAHLIPMHRPEMYAKKWHRYQHLLAYPLDLLAVGQSDVLSLLRRAVASDREIAGWRERMIGDPFDGEAFVNALEGYL